LSDDKLPSSQKHIANGLVFSDPVGMGKTACVVKALKLIIENYPGREYLIIVPGKVLKQWKEEFTLLDITPYTITCKRSLQKYTKLEESPSFVLTNFNILKNNAYLESDILNKEWDGVVVDEAHELSASRSRSKNAILKRESFHKIHTNRKGPLWLITATPTGQSFADVCRMTNWMFNHGKYDPVINDLQYDSRTPKNLDFYEETFKILYRRTSEKDISKWVQIPTPKEINIKVSLTLAEHTLYEAERGDEERMIQMCSHPVCNNFYQKILANSQIQDMESFLDSALKYLNESIPRLQKYIEKNTPLLQQQQMMIEYDYLKYDSEKPQLIKRVDSLKKKEQELKEALFRKSIVDNLENQTKDEDCCVCFGKLDELCLPNCGHSICIPCYQRIENINNKCPLCRETFVNVSRICVEKKENDPQIIRRNKWGSKIVKAMDIVKEILKNEDRRIIIFSRWKKVLNHIEKALSSENIIQKCVSLKGSVHHMAAGLTRFRHSPDQRVALLSSEICSSGVNLIEATDIILFDSLHREKNAQKQIEIQAIGRAVRIGQTKVVNVYRLIAEGTIEEEIRCQN